MTVLPRHHYLAVGTRLVHYVRAGSGPPIVLVHASPGDWRGVESLVAPFSAHGTVIAADTPGHGWSDPLATAQPTIDDYGRALVEFIEGLTAGPVHLYGTHTGAKIALNAAVRRPDRVASLLLDGLGIATPAERADQLAHYTPEHEPRPDGGHLVATWHQVRDMFRFWPWYAQSSRGRLGGTEPSAEDLHSLVHGMLLAGPRYPLAYRAAFRNDPLDDLSRVTVPTALLAAPTDPLHAQLSRLGTAVARVQITLGADNLVSQLADQVAAHGRSASTVRPRGGATSRCFVGVGPADIHLTLEPGAEVRTLLIEPLGGYAEPAEPGSAILEIPGSGRSVPAEGAHPTAETLADSLFDACQAVGLRPAVVRSSGPANAVAGSLARRLGASAQSAAPPGPDPSRALADLRPRLDGAHLLAAWHLVRDAAIRDLASGGRWPGRHGEHADLALIHARAVGLAGGWRSLPEVFAACATSEKRCGAPASDGRPGWQMWDPFADPGSGG